MPYSFSSSADRASQLMDRRRHRDTNSRNNASGNQTDQLMNRQSANNMRSQYYKSGNETVPSTNAQMSAASSATDNALACSLYEPRK